MNADGKSISQKEHDRIYRISYLLTAYLADVLEDPELQELEDWVNASMANQELFEDLTDEKALEKLGAAGREKTPVRRALKKLKQRLGLKTRQPFRGRWLIIPALLVTTATLLWWAGGHKSLPPSRAAAFSVDYAPGARHALLTLGDGRRFRLDSIPRGVLAREGGILLEQTRTEQLKIGYTGGAADERPVETGTLSIPRGAEYHLTLSDGSRVVMNAGSSLDFPLQFARQERRVQLSGEAYFEVAPDPHRPFIIDCGASRIRVLGTHFNVQAYPEDSVQVISLATGSIRINESTELHPGQAARLEPGKQLTEIGPADLESALGWTRGNFVFRQATLASIIPQLSRWYQADFRFTSSVGDHFNAVLPRSLPLSAVIQLLEKTGAVHFVQEGKTILIKK